MKPEISLPCSPQTVVGPYVQPDASSSKLLTLYL